MSENPDQHFQVRDPQGNVYGPADIATLREWIGQGRIIAGMHIADSAGGEWMEVTTHPGLADLFQPGRPAIAPQPAGYTQPVTRVMGSNAGASPAANSYMPSPAAPLGTAPGLDVAYASQGPRPHILAILSLIASIAGSIGIFCVPGCVCIGGPYVTVFGIAAIVMGVVALGKIKADPERYSGHGLALTGVILGISSIVLGITLFALLFIFGVFRH